MRSISKSLDRFAAVLATASSLVSAAGLVAMTAVIAWQVFARYVLNDSPAWSESAALILMSYFVLLAAAVGVYERFHLGFRLFVNMLPLQQRCAVFVVGQLLVVVFGVAMAWNGMALVDFTSSHIIPALGVSRSLVYWPFVICGGLIVLFAAVACATVVRAGEGVDPWS